MPQLHWTEWQPLVIEAPPTDTYILTELLDGRQAFRWYRQPDGTWLGLWDHCVAKVKLGETGLLWQSPVELKDPVAAGIAKLRIFAGLSVEEAAQALSTSRASAYRQWTYARAWLHARLGTRSDPS